MGLSPSLRGRAGVGLVGVGLSPLTMLTAKQSIASATDNNIISNKLIMQALSHVGKTNLFFV